jgi:lipopolysaccharide transport system ATP-binding protein
MSDDVLVRVENVSKRFCRSLKRSLWYGLQDLGSEIGGRRHGGGSGLPQSSADVQLRPDAFWAVKDVSFPVAHTPHLVSPTPKFLSARQASP